MIPLMKTTFSRDEETIESLARFVSTSKRLSMGPECAKFEQRFSEYMGIRHAVLVNSGSSANLLLIQSLKNIGLLHDGDAVGFSAITWSTNVMPLIQLGLVPVPVDCDPTTLNTMSKNLEDTLKIRDIKAMFMTNALGLAGDLERIRDICSDRKILLIEDNCESLGSELPSGKTGTFGIASTNSFFVAHHLSTVEGGMVMTNHDDLAEMLVIARANGWDRNLSPDRQAAIRSKHSVADEFTSKYTFYDLAFNLRPTEITGFLGQDQLRYIVENTKTREQNFIRFNNVVSWNPELIPLRHAHMSVVSSFAATVMVKRPELRKKYIDRFVERGIEIRPVIAGHIQSQPFFKKYVPDRMPLPGAEFVDACGFYCGNYPELSEDDIAMIQWCLAGDHE